MLSFFIFHLNKGNAAMTWFIQTFTSSLGKKYIMAITGFMLGSEEGDPSFNLEIAAAANTEVLRARVRVHTLAPSFSTETRSASVITSLKRWEI